MDLSKLITPGAAGKAKLRVAEEHTAPRVGSGRVHVLATPVMINLIEAAALDALDKHLPPGYQSLGTRIDVQHIAATPVGMKVVAKVLVSRVEGRKVFFTVKAKDEQEVIGEGTHERVVVNVQKFDERIRNKFTAKK